MHPAIARTREYFDSIPPKLEVARRPHSSISERLSAPSPRFGRYECYEAGAFAVTVSLAHAGQVIDFLEDLLSAVHAKGFSVGPVKQSRPGAAELPSAVGISKNGEAIGFAIREGYRRYELTGKEFAAATRLGGSSERYDYRGTGVFTFQYAGSEWGEGCSGEFKCASTETLAARIPEIVAAFQRSVLAQKTARNKRLEDEQRRLEHEELRRRERQRQEADRAAVEAIANEASQWQKLQLAMTYLDQLATDCGESLTIEGRQWIDATRRLIIAADPYRRRLMQLLKPSAPPSSS